MNRCNFISILTKNDLVDVEFPTMEDREIWTGTLATDGQAKPSKAK